MANNFLKKKDRSRIFFRKIILTVPFLSFLFIIFIVFSISTVRVYLQSRQLTKERGFKEEELKAEELKNIELKNKSAEIQDRQGIEKNLREKFQIKKLDEEVIIFVNPKNDNNENSEKKDGNFITRFFKKFFKRD